MRVRLSIGRGDQVVADSLDAEQAPVGGVADLLQRGQIRGSFPIPKIVGVGDGGLGARGLPLLLDRCGLSSTCRLGVTPAVITLVWNRPGVARGPRRIGRGVEDETDLIWAADVEVVADDLLEEDPTRDRCVEHLGQGELGL